MGGLGSDDQVAYEGELAPAAQGEAGDRRDERRLDRGEPAPEGRGGVAERLLEGALPKRADVGAGSEDLVGPRDDDAPNPRFGVEVLDRGRELVHQLGRERVASVGPVQAAEGYVPVEAGLDECAHRSARTGV